MALYIPPRPAIKASPQGPGAGVLLTEFPLSALANQQSPQAKMIQAWRLGIEVPWIRAAELVIAGKIQGLEWHIEDGDGTTIDDDYKAGDGQDLKTLIEKPMANLPVGQQMFRTALWRLTIRHIGLCGNSFWYLDAMNTFGEPNAILYIRPDRMTPNEDNNGNLQSWQLDKSPNNPGITISLEESIHFVYDPPDVGHFGTGLVDSAMLWAQNAQGLDRHLAMLISSGGRLSGILAPKAGNMNAAGSDTSLQIERDWRTIVDTSDAAKRLQIVNAPVDFTKTTLTPAELGLIDTMTEMRDSLLSLWGVPLTALGIHERGSSLSAGAAKVSESDDKTLWEHAVKTRTEPFLEALQYRLADPYQATGEIFNLVFDYPVFDDNSVTYVNAAQALAQPLNNNQRLDIMGYDPIDDAILGESGGPLGLEVWMPATQVYSFTTAPNIANKPAPPPPVAIAAPGNEMDQASLAVGETTQGPGGVANIKARVTPKLHPTVAPLHTALVSLRNRIAAAKTPILKRSVSGVLSDQRHEIADRLRKNAKHVARNPSDTSTWFPAKQFDAALTRALAPHLTVMADSVNATIHDVLPAKKAAPAGAVERVMKRGAARVTGINETTRQKINDAIIRGLEAGSTINDVADAIDAGSSIGGLDLGALFDDYRSEMIARTELMDAYNSSAIATYSDAGFDQLQAIDGDGDPECAARDGQIFSSDDADSIEDHPNGTLDWVPVIEEGKARIVPVHPMVPVDTADVLAFAQDHAQKANAALERVSGMQLAQAALDRVSEHSASVDNLADAIRSQPAAIHNVEAPIVYNFPPEPDTHNINVEAPDLEPILGAINALPAALAQKPTIKTVQRDANNRISSVIETPVDAEPDTDPDD